MIRQALAEKGRFAQDGFRFRGKEVSRVEGFSDCVLGFALTLLVVSLEVPKTFDEMLKTMGGYAAFGICFAFLISIWFNHYTFFRRYGLQDNITLALNAALLFVILLFVYPLKFLFNNLVFTSSASGEVPIRPEQIPQLFVIYGLGYAAVYIILTLLYTHAYRQRAELELSPLESFDTVNSILGNLISMTVPLLSVVLAMTLPLGSIAIAGWIYFLLAIFKTAQGAIMGRRRRKLLAASA
ncbi:MAG: TMEM175 family protein [Chloroflexota bacterium]